ncbi:5-methyltetrahydropteroyltriglutamate--homocysteine S-methyltransferase [Bacillus mojavensis]|uniref:5-methyltetrahydropteroyltriglutamate-- homocysteine S-methyltransferase n=1 Tax=Bacillus mojavensis TaxID=72360 RepID=UPI00227E9EE7|nr:5-methyltetrahydropteroyltriglutamate--homocysteine S-methyltransferase [Bacillus mojavensis]MCY8105725.1 5-methyltetrahydropteroyltriglutamate--homocysteine S-methyltransferase [Bacillus mojavensis]MCY8482364.1 5-methyltetrahydropteroyltriglutamate--homocysteine S-methyltransferase [Bacillus mojavensis]MCY9187775.1 5-methyltetrahydropteroyltriglutamate--homocysteine S-methyltransferase [Bacillus mojavensis]MEC1775148.1 5-methyltetrahydropteroyltriglutamate--homocysteine S-methyltransferase 
MSQQTTPAEQKQSLQRKKPPFRADQVGSLLRSEPVKKARLQKAAGEMTAEQLRQIENDEIIRIVEKQKETGLNVVTDGEFRRAWWHFDFLENLDGVEPFTPEQGIQFHNVQTKARGIKVTGDIDFSNHPMLEDYSFLHGIAGDATPKMTIPSPNMLFFRGRLEKDAYKNDYALFQHDVSKAYKKAIQAFYDRGCRYLQLDDTAWAVFLSEKGLKQVEAFGTTPDELRQLFAKSINDAIADRPDDMTITMHICRGNFQSTWTAEGGYDAAAETIFDGLNLDGLFLEYDDSRSGGFEPLRYVKRTDLQLVLGLVTSKFGELEDPDDVKRRIEEASRYVSLDQLCLSPQCGFASTEEGNKLTEEQQWAKLRHVVEIANDVWK